MLCRTEDDKVTGATATVVAEAAERSIVITRNLFLRNSKAKRADGRS
jgi:hypothetical protein